MFKVLGMWNGPLSKQAPPSPLWLSRNHHKSAFLKLQAGALADRAATQAIAHVAASAGKAGLRRDARHTVLRRGAFTPGSERTAST